MPYQPRFAITPLLLARVESVAALRERILAAAVEVPWVPALQKESRARTTHSSTAIEGNPLTLEEVRALEEDRAESSASPHAAREVLNYFAALRYVEKSAVKTSITPAAILRLHKIVASGVMQQGEAGRWRAVRVRVGPYVPPPPSQVARLMDELLEWWNRESAKLSPVISSAIVHYRLEAIHPFADGNGRLGRSLALWELYRRGFDSHHLFAVDEYYWENRGRYYAALHAVHTANEDLTSWLEYCAEGIRVTLERVWKRIQDECR